MRAAGLVALLTAASAASAAAAEPARPKAQPGKGGADKAPADKAPADKADPGPEWVRMEVSDVMSAGGNHVVLLRAQGTRKVLPIWIGQAEALAISLRMARQSTPRPLTHDLIERMLSRLDARIERIHIEDLRNHVFLGRVFVRRDGHLFDVDARPSDSIALAVGAQAPIFASRKVVQAAAIDEDALGSPGAMPPPAGGDDPPSRSGDAISL